jgi:hypothetical protein
VSGNLQVVAHETKSQGLYRIAVGRPLERQEASDYLRTAHFLHANRLPLGAKML